MYYRPLRALYYEPDPQHHRRAATMASDAAKVIRIGGTAVTEIGRSALAVQVEANGARCWFPMRALEIDGSADGCGEYFVAAWFRDKMGAEHKQVIGVK